LTFRHLRTSILYDGDGGPRGDDVRDVRIAALAAALVLAAAAAGPASAAPGPPPAPTDLVVQGFGEGATLAWQQPPGPRASAFRVYENGTVIARNTTTSVRLTNLGFASTHTYTVTAVDAAGRESASSAPLSRVLGVSGVPPFCLPSPPAGLAVTDVTPTAATLTWANGGDPAVTIVTGAPGGPVLTDAAGVRVGGLAPDTSYTLSVERRPECGGPDAPAVEVTVRTPPGPAGTPAAPIPAAPERTDTTITLSWQPPAAGTPAARYAVYRSGRRVAATSGTSATVRGLYHAASYTFQIAALDARGGESPAVTVGASTLVCQANPPRPVAVTATALSASSVRLNWVYDAEAVAYTVYDGAVAVGTSAGPAVVVGGLASATAYRLRVVAALTSGCGVSPGSAAAGVTTAAGPAGRPARPTDLRVESGDPVTSVVTLAWTQPAGGDPAVGYRVYRGTEILATTDTGRVALALPRATTQALSVAAVNADGLESAHTAPLTVRVPYLPPP
jgi:chitodextrinase